MKQEHKLDVAWLYRFNIPNKQNLRTEDCGDS